MPQRVRPLHRAHALQECDGFEDVIFKIEWPTLSVSAAPKLIKLAALDNKKYDARPDWMEVGKHPLDLRQYVHRDGFALLGYLHQVGPVKTMLGAYDATEIYSRRYATFYVPRQRTHSRRPEIVFLLLGRNHAMFADFRQSAFPLISERKAPQWVPKLT